MLCSPSDADTQVLISERTAFALLGSGVPLSLLLDLATPIHSDELLRAEHADTSWIRHAAA